MFEEKTVEEFEAMTAKEQADYLVAKRTHEASETEKKITDAIAKAKEQSDAENKEVIEVLETKLKSLQNDLEEFAVRMKAIGEDPKTTQTEKSDLIKFVERTERNDNGWESTTVKAAALMSTANVVPNVSGGFNQLFGNYIDPTIHSAPKRDVFIMNLVDTQLASGTEKIWYAQRINEEGDAAFIGEGSLKPLADGEYKEFSADIKEVAVRWKITRRLRNHAPTAVADFRSHADDLVSLKMDDGVLTGDGTGNNLAGVAELASPFVVPTELANFYASANIFDAINAVATYVALNNFKGQLTCVLNTVWKAKFFGYKETNGAYILPSFVSGNGETVGSTRVIFENGMASDKILLGDLKRFKVRIAEDVRYDEGYENDDFSKNLESRKLEAFLGTYFPSQYAGSIIYDDIATVLTAIEVEAV